MKRNLRLIVCGGRDYADHERVYAVLGLIHGSRGIAEVIHGACPTGADHFARSWAVTNGVKETPVPASWREYGPSAGPRRNARMVAMKPDGVVAFPGGRGTADCVRQAKAAGIIVWEISTGDPLPAADPH